MASKRALRRGGFLALALGLGALALSPGCAITTDNESTERPLWHRIDEPAIVTCAPCHQEVYDEWAESLHHGAWINPNVVQATDNFAKKECRSCHSPMPVLPRGLDRRPRYRDFNQEDGVHCLSCHGLENGVAAARDLPDAPCRPRYEPRLLDANMCYPCHEPTHQAFAEYRRSDAFATGIRCVDCHMPPTKHRRGRSHGPHGGMNAEFVKRALAWECSIANGALHIELRNRCGHKFPGEIPSRSFLVEVTFGDSKPQHEVLRRPFKGEGRRDNRLRPDETRILRYPIPTGVATVKVRLLFKPLPLLPIEKSFVLGSWQQSLK